MRSVLKCAIRSAINPKYNALHLLGLLTASSNESNLVGPSPHFIRKPAFLSLGKPMLAVGLFSNYLDTERQVSHKIPTL